MKLTLIYISVLCFIFVSFLYSQGDEPFIEGNSFEFKLTDLYNNLITSNDSIFYQKVIYITLWGTWCPPCISEIPTLIDLHKKYREDGLIITAIAFERDESYDARRNRLIKFIREHNINYLVFDGGTPVDFENAFPAIKNAVGLPIEILINRNGNVVVIRNSYGFSEVWAGRLEQEIKTLLKN